MATIYLHDWATANWRGHVGQAALMADFEISEADLAGVDLLFASYGTEYGYDGAAFVLFQRDGQLYEVNGSHCSCYGLEGQWKPEATSVAALLHRIHHGQLGKDGASPFADELLALLLTLPES